MSFRLLPKSVTLNDIELRYGYSAGFLSPKRHILEATTSIWLRIYSSDILYR